MGAITHGRLLLGEGFEMASRPGEGTPEEARALLVQIDETAAALGMDRWNDLVDAEAAAYRDRTGRCPWCGGPADHEPEDF